MFSLKTTSLVAALLTITACMQVTPIQQPAPALAGEIKQQSSTARWYMACETKKDATIAATLMTIPQLNDPGGAVNHHRWLRERLPVLCTPVQVTKLWSDPPLLTFAYTRDEQRAGVYIKVQPNGYVIYYIDPFADRNSLPPRQPR